MAQECTRTLVEAPLFAWLRGGRRGAVLALLRKDRDALIVALLGSEAG
jgi:hypothetical protein